jgi:signal transduction histidine kinase
MTSPMTASRVALRSTPGPLLGVLLAAGTLAVTLALLWHGGVAPDDAAGRLDAAGVLLATCSTLPVAAWRWWPLGAFGATAAAGVALAAVGYPVDLLLGPAAAIYLYAASRTSRAPWTGTATVTVVTMFAAYLVAATIAIGAVPAIPLLHTGMAWAVAWFAGERTRLRREHLDDLHARAARAEHDAERERQLAVAEERARIARDLHDSAGHAISLIAVRAGAARLRHASEPQRSGAALQSIEDLARDTAAEIDHLVGSLRNGDPADPDGTAPAGLASLEMLIARQSEAGLTVRLHTVGRLRPLGAAADQAAYRILQESLNNAARHGTGVADVELTYADTAVEITVSNPAGPGGSGGGGHGLVGMRERAHLVDGELTVENTDVTFRVRARIPYGGRR